MVGVSREFAYFDQPLPHLAPLVRLCQTGMDPMRLFQIALALFVLLALAA